MIEWQTIASFTGRSLDFIPLEQLQKENTSHIIPERMVGAIIVKVDGHVVLDDEYQDAVIFLWGDLAYYLAETLLKKETIVGFHEHPTDWGFTPTAGDKIAMSVDGKQFAEVDRRELIREVSQKGVAFFEKMIEIFPQDTEDYREYIEMLKAIGKSAQQ